MIELLLSFTKDNWLAIIAIIISVISLYKSYNDGKIKIDASLNVGYSGDTIITIYNNSNRLVSITGLQVVMSELNLTNAFSKNFKHTVHTPIDGSLKMHYEIEPYKFVEIQYKGRFPLDISAKHQYRYAKLYVSGKLYANIKL